MGAKKTKRSALLVGYLRDRICPAQGIFGTDWWRGAQEPIQEKARYADVPICRCLARSWSTGSPSHLLICLKIGESSRWSFARTFEGTDAVGAAHAIHVASCERFRKVLAMSHLPPYPLPSCPLPSYRASVNSANASQEQGDERRATSYRSTED
eukprot:scaffold986_cov237-Pinguiococcus_pyrenoidosus.AAC.27